MMPAYAMHEPGSGSSATNVSPAAFGRDANSTSVLDETPEFTRQRPGGVFLVISGPDRGEQAVLRDSSVTVGSAPGCELVLSDRTVSRRHITASLENHQVVVRDLSSTNGSFTHGSRFKEITIGYGAELKLGKTVLKFLPQEEVLEPTESSEEHFGQLLGRDTKMRRLFGLLRDIAPSDTTVLIEGETGTGKELIAEEIHHHSRRASGPFVVFDCGAVPRDLIESTLFGHVKGAFTGAISDRKGAFAEAHGGTIFLDEIGELGLDLQPALLRALDKRAVRRVGGNAYEQIDVRVIAATNVDPAAAVKSGKLREDLYYRLNVFTIGLPPLRDRKEDLPLLVQTFVEEFNQRDQKAVKAVDPEAMRRLEAYHWPGNVRELRNVIERAVILAKGDFIEAKHLPPLSSERRPAVAPTAPGSEVMLTPGMTVDEAEQKLILATLDAASGNKTRAAEMLGISLKTLHNKLNRMKQGA